MELKEYKLGDIAEISTGYPFDGNLYAKEGIRVLRGENIGDGILKWDDRIDKKWNAPFSKSDIYTLRDGDIVMQMDGNVGRNKSRVFAHDLPMLIAQRVGCIRSKKEIADQDFLYYVICSERYLRYINKVKTGTSIHHISLSQISNYTLSIPPLITQKRIADVLSSFDKQIALNKLINQNLEALARQLYDYWFVQFDFPNEKGKPYKSSGGKMVYNPILKREIPEGWENGILSDIANITMGQSPDGSSYNEEGDGVIFYQGSTDFGERFPKIRQYTTAPSRFAKKGDILMSVRAPVGDLNIANNDCCIGRGLSALNSKVGSITHLYYIMLSFKDMFERKSAIGTTFGSINKDELYNLPIIKPTTKIIKLFENKCKPIFDQQMSLGYEIDSLTKQRDELLPLLMNGQVNFDLSDD